MSRKLEDLHPATRDVLRFFEYEHLPPFLQRVSILFYDLAHALAADETCVGAQLTLGLQRLLEAKDCIVRASIPFDRVFHSIELASFR
jgi:hypothetical protein